MWNRMVENLPSVLEHFLAGCSSCFVEFSAAFEALSFALDARRVKLPSALGVAYLTTKLSSEIPLILSIQAVNANSTNFLFSFLTQLSYLNPRRHFCLLYLCTNTQVY